MSSRSSKLFTLREKRSNHCVYLRSNVEDWKEESGDDLVEVELRFSAFGCPVPGRLAIGATLVWLLKSLRFTCKLYSVLMNRFRSYAHLLT
jgi:hypothetical protein